MQEKFDGDFDWVTERSSCSPSQVFEKLKLQVIEDVRLRSSLPPNGLKFAVVKNGSSFFVTKQNVGELVQPGHSVKFTLTEDAIEVCGGRGAETFEAAPTLSDDGKCRLKINEQEHQFWQFRRRALEALFFR